MEKKRTQMSKGELGAYIRKWTKELKRYLQGSKNWRKCWQRIRIAEKLLSKAG